MPATIHTHQRDVFCSVKWHELVRSHATCEFSLLVGTTAAAAGADCW